MSTFRLLADLAVAPARGLAAAAERRAILAPILMATLASLLFAAVLVPRVDWEATARKQLDRLSESAQRDSAQLTPHETEEMIATVRKLGAVTAYGGAAVGSALLAVAAASLLWLGLQVAGAKPSFLPALAVTAWGLLPGALSRILLLPALLARETVDPQSAGALAPWSAAWFLPAGASPSLAALASSVNLFSLWSAVLLAIGMAIVARVSRARAGAVVGLLWALVTAAGMAAANFAGA